MLERLEEEQRPFLGDSQRHPDYAARWKEFYSRKCDECATRGVPPPRMQVGSVLSVTKVQGLKERKPQGLFLIQIIFFKVSKRRLEMVD